MKKDLSKKQSTLGKNMMHSLKIINTLNAKEFVSMNQMIVCRLKELQREECVEKSRIFKIGDFVSFNDSTKKREGIVVRINQKTIKVFTTESVFWNISPHFLGPVKPSKKLKKFAEETFPEIFIRGDH
jgi:hypothetical protein